MHARTASPGIQDGRRIVWASSYGEFTPRRGIRIISRFPGSPESYAKMRHGVHTVYSYAATAVLPPLTFAGGPSSMAKRKRGALHHVLPHPVMPPVKLETFEHCRPLFRCERTQEILFLTCSNSGKLEKRGIFMRGIHDHCTWVACSNRPCGFQA